MDLVSLSRKINRPDWAVEIKWSNRFFEAPIELKSLSSFCAGNKLKEALVTTIDKSGVKEYITIQIQYLPVSVYAYNVEKNTIESQR